MVRKALPADRGAIAALLAETLPSESWPGEGGEQGGGEQGGCLGGEALWEAMVAERSPGGSEEEAGPCLGPESRTLHSAFSLTLVLGRGARLSWAWRSHLGTCPSG